MNIAVIFAGGTGQRMKTKTKPKQFLELHGKPIIIYTLEQFENCTGIDGIIISCLESWIPYLEKLIKIFDISKVKAIVPGGETGQGSIRNGIMKANELFPEDSIILVHDGVRPLIEEETILQAIECVKENGSAITVAPAIETIALKEDGNEINEIIDRSKCQYAKAPQCFYLRDLVNAHNKAVEENIDTFIDTASLMKYYGYPLFTVEGKNENIKITTPSDFYIFSAIIDARNNNEIFG